MVHLLDQMVVVEEGGLLGKLAKELSPLGAGSAVVDLHLVRQTLGLPGSLNRNKLTLSSMRDFTDQNKSPLRGGKTFSFFFIRVLREVRFFSVLVAFRFLS